MRIYRTRNMIVHDGTQTIYIDLILQNLHYYLDTLIDTIYAAQEKGYHNITAVFRKMSAIEKAMLTALQKESFNDEDIRAFCMVGALYSN